MKYKRPIARIEQKETEELRARFKEYRKEKGIALLDLSLDIGVSPMTLGHFEQGRVNTQQSVQRTIKDFLNEMNYDNSRG